MKAEVIYMAKCIRCGKSTMIRGHVKLRDAAICRSCFKDLGFDAAVNSVDIITASLYTWDEVKDGHEEWQRKKWAKQREKFNRDESERLGLRFTDYGLLDKLDCSDNEMKTIERVCLVLDDEGCDPRKLSYEREPGCPLSAFVCDDLLYQLKYTKEIKWIKIAPDLENKIRITGPAGINKLAGRLAAAYNQIIEK